MGHRSGASQRFPSTTPCFSLKRTRLMGSSRNGHTPTPRHTQVEEEEVVRGLSDHDIGSSLLSSPQEYQIDIIFAQTWVDTRLRYNSSSTRMPTLTLNRWRLRMSRMFGGEKQSAASYRDTGYRTRSRPRRQNVSLSSPPPLSGIFTLRISHWRTKFLPLTGEGP